AKAGLPVPAGPMTIAPVRERDGIGLERGRLTGRAHVVPFVPDVAHLVLIAETQPGPSSVALIDAADLHFTREGGISGDPVADVALDGITPVTTGDAPAGSGGSLMLMGAAARTMQMAGALEAILDLSVRYANERVAFERPIGKFQAVQHNIARLAG